MIGKVVCPPMMRLMFRDIRAEPAGDSGTSLGICTLPLTMPLAPIAKIYVSFVTIIHTAERAQLDGGLQYDDIDRFVRQIELELLRAAKIDALVGRCHS